MKNTTNAIQRRYARAEAMYIKIAEAEQESEERYLRANGIISEDGKTPRRIWCIDDEEVFERINTAYCATDEAKELERQSNAARAELESAKEALITYALSIMPALERETLKHAAAKDVNIRMKIIDLVMKLDVSTVR